MPEPPDTTGVACLVLAGGEGRRLSPDKPLLHVSGRPIISRVVEVVSSIFTEILLVTNTPEKYAFLGLPHVRDEEPGHGPLMGIYSGLGAVSAPMAFVCAADMPFLDADLIRAVLREAHDHDMVIPYPRGLPEFLHGLYRVRCLPALKKQLDAGRHKIDLLRGILDVHVLDEGWFRTHGFHDMAGKVFTNINTQEDYRAWTDEGGSNLPDIPADLLARIRSTLVQDESRYQREHGTTEFSSLWSHSIRVAAIARTLAAREGLDATAAVLASVLHDAGKFHQGLHHEDDVVEEEPAAELAEQMLTGSAHEPLLPGIRSAILSLYREDAGIDPLGAVVHDADRIDKLGCMGIAQFFTKNTLRGRYLDDDLIIRASVELTYAFHAQRTLRTRTGREMASSRTARVRDFLDGLLEEWQELGMGSFHIDHTDVEGITLVLIVPDACSCGSAYEIRTDIEEGIKCRSAVVEYACARCGHTRDLSFCLPVLAALLDHGH
jgi:molybdopterin-guanine dinucleotide biosynthesis protein A/HD superfamily phosphodiesterase